MSGQVLERTLAFRGAAQEVFSCRAGEVLLCGAAGTGKSYAALSKLHMMMLANPGARGLAVRKTHVSLTQTGLVTFREQVLPEALKTGLVRWYGGSGEKPAGYVYDNGSFVAVGGLDQPLKIMSSEYDCLIGSALVDSPSEIQRAYGRPYSGQLITIATAGGKQLTGTPNHPVFTDRGWVGLGQLRQGDNVVCRARVQPEGIGGARPHVTDQPAPIAEIARALTLAGASRAERIETVPVDFHGDGGYGYVDVVTAGSLLQRGDAPSLLEHLLEVEGERRDFQYRSLMGVRALREARLAGAPATVALADLSAEISHACAISVGSTPGFMRASARASKVRLPSGIGAHPLVPLGESLRGSLPGDAAIDHFGFEASSADVNRERGFGEPQFPFAVELDRIVDVSATDAGSGRHVYNLQTADSWYIANGIVSHNCIYSQEATDLTLADWEYMTSRLRNGVISFQQLLADCNPQHPSHWLHKRCQEGKTVLLTSLHEDNPRIFNVQPDGSMGLTSYGTDYIARLDSLTGVRKLRLRYGQWAAAEGIIFADWRPEVHLSDRKILPPDWPRIWGVDFGYTNPFVWQMWARDPDGRLWLEKEIYRTQTLVADHAKAILEVVTRVDGKTWKYPRPSAVICDHDAEDRATLERELGIGTIPAWKGVSDGIQAVQQRLRVQPDGRPRLMVCRDSLVSIDSALRERGRPTRFAEEIEGYVWKRPAGSAQGSQEKPPPDEPNKADDHSMDTTRYVVAYEDLAPRPSIRWM